MIQGASFSHTHTHMCTYTYTHVKHTEQVKLGYKEFWSLMHLHACIGVFVTHAYTCMHTCMFAQRNVKSGPASIGRHTHKYIHTHMLWGNDEPGLQGAAVGHDGARYVFMYLYIYIYIYIYTHTHTKHTHLHSTHTPHLHTHTHSPTYTYYRGMLNLDYKERLSAVQALEGDLFASKRAAPAPIDTAQGTGTSPHSGSPAAAKR